VPIISGERELHNGNIKINQSMEVLNRYQNLVEGFGIQLLLPLKTLHEGRHIEEILGFDWREGREQLECTLSGNYRFSDKGNAITEKDVLAYLDEFAIPCATEIINAYIAGNVPNHMEIAARVLKK
jgi:hypothetical protein